MLLPLLAAFAAAVPTPVPTLGQTPGPPNVLLVVLDDVGADQLGIYGAGPDAPATPNLDALAGGGVWFRNAWSNPNCTPSRAQLVTGRFGFRTGVGEVLGPDPTEPALPTSELTLPVLLRTAGYETAAFGKWHLGNDTNGGPFAPNLAGFDHYRGVLDNLDLFGAPLWTYFAWAEIVDGVAVYDTGYLTSEETDDALAWIAQVEGPWFCQVGYHAAHSPYHVPPQGLSSLPAGSVVSNTTIAEQHDAMIEALDHEVGRLLDGLGHHAADTLVIVVGDNGTAGPGLPPGVPPGQGKHSISESGVLVPLFATGAGVPGRGPSDALVHVADVFATAVEVAGVDPALLAGTIVDGRSLQDELESPGEHAVHPFLFTERFRPNGPGVGLPPGGVPILAGRGPLCQPSLGFAGPGTATLALCSDDGQAIVPGSTHHLTVTGAPPGAGGWLAISEEFAPVRLGSGTFAPGLDGTLLPIKAGPSGGWQIPFAGETFLWEAPVDLVAQAAFVDPSQVGGFALTNALTVEVPPVDMKSVRDADGWKLVVVGYGGAEQLYHLPTDPFEQDDLLADGGPNGLEPEAFARYQALRQGLHDLLATEALHELAQ